MSKIPNIVFYNDEGDEITLTCIYTVCTRCEGTGRHTNPSIDGDGITGSEMQELGYEFQQDYFNGAYDVECYECKGNRVVPVPDECMNSPEDLALYQDHLEEEERYQAEIAMELRSGC